MKTFRTPVAALLSTALLAACSSQPLAPIATQSSVNRFGPSSTPLARVFRPTLKSTSGGRLYVANAATITAYADKSKTRVLRIPLQKPARITIDTKGNLFAGSLYSSTISVVNLGSKKVIRTFSNGNSNTYSLTIDAANNLYVGSTSVNVYVPGMANPERTINEQNALATAMTLDASGDLYVGWYRQNGGVVAAYKPGGTSPYRVLSTGINEPEGLAVDSNGDLAVANFGDSTVQVYAPGSDTPLTITDGINHPNAALYDAAGYLYVANLSADTVTVYGPGQTSPARTITSWILRPSSLTMDPGGNLYVANSHHVTMYPPGSNNLGLQIGKHQGVISPIFVIFH